MKKKLFFFASLLTAAAATLGLTSCSNEMTPDQPIREGMVDVVMTTSLPQALQSYAVSSDKSGLENLEGEEGLYVRYIMEVYNKTTSTEPVVRKICYKPLVSGGDYKTASFQTRLVAAQYNFVFWADIVREVTELDNSNVDMSAVGLSKPFYGNRYFLTNKENPEEGEPVLVHATNADTYSAGTLQEISANVQADSHVGHITGEMYDGYTANEVIDLRSEVPNKSILLKRPFAKLRVITTDADVMAQQDINPADIIMTLFYNSTIPSTYNALTKSSSGSANLNALYKNNAIYDAENENTTEKTVGVMYCLPPASVDELTLNLSVYGSDIYSGIPVNAGMVPLVANKLTTIKGNLFSKNPKITVEIKDEFEGDETIIDLTEHEVSSVDDLKNVLTGKDQRVTLTGEVTKADGFELDFTNVARTTPVYAEGNNATLTLTFASIEEGAVLTFKGTNAPKNLRITTGTKCSLIIDLSSTDVYYDGLSYKYIVTNAGFAGEKENLQFDVLFVADPGDGFFPADISTAHSINITSDFKLPDNVECTYAPLHDGSTCTFINTLKTWFQSNSAKDIRDFVKEYKEPSNK